MAKRITAEQITRMRELRTAGLSSRQVAQRVGVSQSTVSRAVPGINSASVQRAKRRELAERLVAAGHTAAEIAAQLGVTESAVYQYGLGFKHSPPLTSEQIAQIRELRADGHTCLQTAAIIGCSAHAVWMHAPGRIGKVPVAPLREAFLASPMTAADVAREIGWWDRSWADSARVKRTLGLLDDVHGHNGSARRSRRTLADAETVGLIAEAIGVAAWSVMPDDDRPAWATESEAA